MNKNKIIILMVSSGIWIGAQLSTAATIPAGTTLQVRTRNMISSQDTAGKKFQGHLVQDVTVKGTVLLPVGTAVIGVVESPRVQVGSITRPLTLRLTQVSIRGNTMPIKTQAYEAENMSAWKGGRGRVQITGGAFVLPPGTTLQFRLAQPLTL